LSVIRDTYARFEVLIQEVGKFGLVGIGSTILTLGIENVLLGPAGSIASAIIANAIATVFAFIGNRYWAFKHRKSDKVARETVLFIFFNVVGTLIQLAFVDGNRDLLHNPDTNRLAFDVASVLGIGIATLFRLFCYRAFVFKSVPDAGPAEELSSEPATMQ
jgi:putative flippase GtrA